MQKVQLLIIDENFDFGKSLSKLITDIFNDCSATVHYTNSIHDALSLVASHKFHFLFIRGYKENEKTTKLKDSLKQTSINKNVRIITLSFDNETYQNPKTYDYKKTLSADEEIITDELVTTLEIMKDNFKTIAFEH